MTEAEFRTALSYVRDQLDLAIPNGRYSSILSVEIAAHMASRSANIFQILHELRVLDGALDRYPSQTKPAAEFRGVWLGGLWHKHYMQARFIPQNLANHWKREGIPNILAPMAQDRDSFEAKDIGEIAHRLVQGSYLDRCSSRQLTGEWIVYAISGGVNFYLTLADHSEPDEVVWERCKASANEFPALTILQEDRLLNSLASQ